ncbi:MAG TPA: hypothetical protein VLD63_02865 [Anaerolineales bacterium]|nr:hypothetical protein [Anaerolineales bacterium]
MFESLFLSEDAKYVLLEGENEDQVRAFPSGEIASPPQDVEWLRTSTMRESWGTIKATSPDGSLRLESHNELSEEWFEIEYSIREIYDRASGNLKYTLKDQTIQISYDDRTSPEGCDLPVFAIDGNALAPAAAHPYRAAFSPSGGVLGILYRAPNLWDSKWFSTLRLYDSTDGKILRLIGSLQRPVETFAFSPDTEEVVVAYIDGGIEVWDPYEASPELAATHFTSDIVNMAYTSSGDFVLVQRFGTVEIRRSADGAMRSRHDATAFAISPAGDQVAIGTQHGVVQVFDVPSGETIQRIDAHSAEVYALAFTPDGKTLASSGEDCRVLAWDVHSGRLKHLYQENATDPYELGEKSRVFIYKLDFIPGTSRLIGFGSWGRVVGWDANTGETKYFFEPEPLEFYHGMMTAKPHFPEDMRIAPEEGLFYIGGAAYDLDSGENVAQANMRAIPPSGCFEVGPSLENGRFLVTIGYEEREGQLCLVNASDLSLPATIRILDAERPEDVIVLWPVASPDRHRLLLPLNYGSIYVAQVSYPRTP